MNVEDSKRRLEIVTQHKEIAQSLLDKDPIKASQLMNSHIYTDMIYLMKYLDASNLN